MNGAPSNRDARPEQTAAAVADDAPAASEPKADRAGHEHRPRDSATSARLRGSSVPTASIGNGDDPEDEKYDRGSSSSSTAHDGHRSGVPQHSTPLHGHDAVRQKKCESSSRTAPSPSPHSSSLSTSPERPVVTPTWTDDQNSERKKRVRWDRIQTREYALVVGDHPLCQDGLPVSLDWRYTDSVPSVCIESHTRDTEATSNSTRATPVSPSQHWSPVGSNDDCCKNNNNNNKKENSCDSATRTSDATTDSRHESEDASSVGEATHTAQVAQRSSVDSSSPSLQTSTADTPTVKYRRSSYTFPRRLSYEERRQRLLVAGGYSEEQINHDEMDLMARKFREHWNINACPLELTEPTPVDYTPLDCNALLSPNRNNNNGDSQNRNPAASTSAPVTMIPLSVDEDATDSSACHDLPMNCSNMFHDNRNWLLSFMPTNISPSNRRWNDPDELGIGGDDMDTDDPLGQEDLADMMILDEAVATAMDFDLTDFEWGDVATVKATSSANE